MTTQSRQRLHAPAPTGKRTGWGDAEPPRGGLKAAVRAAGLGRQGRPSRRRLVSPTPFRPRTYPAGRAPGLPAVVIAEGGGRRAPAGRQLRPRCGRRNPSPWLCSGAADAAAGEGRAGGGEGGGAGPDLGLPTRAVGPRPPPSCGLRPHPGFGRGEPRAPTAGPAHARVPFVRSPQGPGASSFLTQLHLFGARKLS